MIRSTALDPRGAKEAGGEGRTRGATGGATLAPGTRHTDVGRIAARAARFFTFHRPPFWSWVGVQGYRRLSCS